MNNEKKGMKAYFGIMFVVFFSLISLSLVFVGIEASEQSKKTLGMKKNYVLTIDGKHISLQAKEAPLKAILQEISQEMNVDMEINLPEEEKITIKFKKLTLEEALKRLSPNYMHVRGAQKEKIIIFPEGKDIKKSQSSGKKDDTVEKAAQKKSPGPKSFQFEFDPAEMMKEKK